MSIDSSEEDDEDEEEELEEADSLAELEVLAELDCPDEQPATAMHPKMATIDARTINCLRNMKSHP